jgi:hypothetical protein
VYVYRVTRLDDAPAAGVVAVDAGYLAGNIAAAGVFQAETPEDWEERSEKTSLRGLTLDRVLDDLALSARPRVGHGSRETRAERPMLLIREDRLRQLAADLGVAVKTFRREELTLRSNRL